MIALFLVAAMTLSAAGAPDPDEGPRAPAPTAIYFMHVGESNKPIYPFVLCLEEPPEAEREKILGESHWREAKVFVVSGDTLDAAFRIVEARRAEAAESEQPGKPYAYGTFDVTVVTPSGHTTIRLSPAQSARAFEALYEGLSKEHEGLRSHLRNVLRRLGREIPEAGARDAEPSG